MARARVLTFLASMSAFAPLASLPQRGVRDDAAAEKLGWRLGTQAWTFRDRSAFEVVEIADRLGLKYVEFYPGQKLRKGDDKLLLNPDLAADQVAAFKKHLEKYKVKAVSFGVVSFTKDEAAGRKLFEFAKTLGLENLSAEPELDALDLMDKLASEYSIKIALHNHPQGDSQYWNPEAVLEAMKGRKQIGACADTGHWTRSGLVPVDCLKKLEGHVIELHFKDLSDFGKKEAFDLPWGMGKSDARGILAELKRQGFRGLISVEYESGAGPELEANVARCIGWFDETAKELASAKQ